MTGPNIMPTSTTPTTFAKALDAALLTGAALAALAVLGWAAADYAAISAGEAGSARLYEALALEPGTARDAALDAAQRQLSEALKRRRGDAQLWSRLAETRLQQATGAAVSDVSAPLVAASADAGAQVQRLGRANAADFARQAYALSLLPGKEGEAGEALAQSYTLEPLGTGLSERRLRAALLVWGRLPEPARSQAVAEACETLADPTADQVAALAFLRAPRPSPASCPLAGAR